MLGRTGGQKQKYLSPPLPAPQLRPVKVNLLKCCFQSLIHFRVSILCPSRGLSSWKSANGRKCNIIRLPSTCPSPSLPLLALRSLPLPQFSPWMLGAVCRRGLFVDVFSKEQLVEKSREADNLDFQGRLLADANPCLFALSIARARGSIVRARLGEVCWEAALLEASGGPSPSPQGMDVCV